MKHIFHVSPTVAESLGLERILMFYNVIAEEETDADHDYENAGGNVLISPDLSSEKIETFVKDLSYNEKPFVLSSISKANVKFSQLYDWEIVNLEFDENIHSLKNNILLFNVYKKGDHKIFGNIHKYYLKNIDNYHIEIIDWNEDFIDQVNELVNSLNDLEDGYSSIECNIENGKLSVLNITPNTVSIGIETYTRAEIMDNKVPFILHKIYHEIDKEDKVSYHEDFSMENPVSQSKSYGFTQINVRCKYETLIKNDFASGVWKYGGDNTGKTEKICIALYEIDEEGDKTLCLLHRGYSVYDIDGQEGFVVNTRRKNTNIKSNDVLFSIKAPTSVLDSNENLYGWVTESIKAIITIQTK